MTDTRKKPQENHSQTLSNPVIPQTQTWYCTECRFVLGYTDRDKSILRIKFKDQYVQVKKAEEISSMCRRCGQWNTLLSLSE